MDYKINTTYKVSKIHEFSMDYNGFNYLVIYGHHINGGFIAVPNWQICTEAAAPEDVFYNTESLSRVLDSPETAKAIAQAIREHAKELCPTDTHYEQNEEMTSEMNEQTNETDINNSSLPQPAEGPEP